MTAIAQARAAADAAGLTVVAEALAAEADISVRDARRLVSVLFTVCEGAK